MASCTESAGLFRLAGCLGGSNLFACILHTSKPFACTLRDLWRSNQTNALWHSDAAKQGPSTSSIKTIPSKRPFCASALPPLIPLLCEMYSNCGLIASRFQSSNPQNCAAYASSAAEQPALGKLPWGACSTAIFSSRSSFQLSRYWSCITDWRAVTATAL